MMTRIFSTKEDLIFISKECGKILKYGGIVVFPTETVYGIGADAFNVDAVKKIYKIKGRAKDNPLIFHICNYEMLKTLGILNPLSLKLIRHFWPGPLTLVLKSKIHKKYTFNLDTVAIRMPENIIALKLIESLQFPVVAPSANISGKPSGTDFSHVLQDFDGKVDAIIDGGKTVYGIESTVLDVTLDKPVLLRPGAIPIEDIESLGVKVLMPERTELKKRSPGTRYRHYAPELPLYLVEKERELLNLLKNLKDKKVGFMGIERYNASFDKEIIFKDMNEYGSMLFSTLRYLDSLDLDCIVAFLPEKTGIGRAIRDRLMRASEKSDNL